MGKLPSKFAFYDDGSVIGKAERLLYRSRLDLQRAFPDPFATGDGGGYKQWYASNVPAGGATYRVVDIPSRAPWRDVVADIADWLQRRSHLAGNRIKRGALTLAARTCRLLAGRR